MTCACKLPNSHFTDIIIAHSASNISFDEEARRLTLSFEHELPLSKSAKLEVRYEGTMNDVMAGFYRSKYKPATIPHPSTPKDGDRHLMFSTQFESSDACRAFPCFDEPNLKATFDFSIEIPEGQIALSNMPEKETQKGSSGRKIVSFRRTPIMSTYVRAICSRATRESAHLVPSFDMSLFTSTESSR